MPEEELALAVRLLVSDAHVIEEDDLESAVARLVGWGRSGPDIVRALEQAIDNLVDVSALRRSGSTLTLSV